MGKVFKCSMWCLLYNAMNGHCPCFHFNPIKFLLYLKTSLELHFPVKCHRCEGQIRQVTWVDDTVTEIMRAAKDEAAPAAELSEAPDSKMEEEAEVSTGAASEADVKEAEEDDGIHTFFSLLVTFISQIQDR